MYDDAAPSRTDMTERTVEVLAMNEKTSDIRVREEVALLAPAQLKHRLPLSSSSAATVVESRKRIGEILAGRDDRMVAIVGPCSIHDTDAASRLCGAFGGTCYGVRGRTARRDARLF